MNKGSSKSLLPLVEILVAIAIFSVAVILTLQLFFFARFLGDKTSDTAKAIFEVQNVAETIKMMETGGEIERYITEELGVAVNGGIVRRTGEDYILYYDADWDIAGDINGAEYMMKIYMDQVAYNTGSLYKFKLDFYKTEAYPFIDDNKSKENGDYLPLLVSIDANKFVRS